MIRLFSFLLVLAIVAVPGIVLAQGDDLTDYQNSSFTVSVPSALEIQDESDTSVTFVDDSSSIEIAPVTLTEEAQAALQNLGDIQSSLVTIMEIAFASSDYTTQACGTALPCVEFVDLQGAVLVRATIANAGGTTFYSITFRAADEQALATLQPDVVVASFAFADGSASSEAQFNVAATGSVNVRDCAGTECGIVGQTTNGQVLGVLATEGDWYQVQWEDGTAYIASWLTTRGPDVHVDLASDPYEDPVTGCLLALNTSRGDSDFNVLLTGERQDEIWADVYRPGEGTAVTVDAQYDKTFIDTEEPYIHQVYGWGEYWPLGTYQVQITLGDASSMIAFDVATAGEQDLYVLCD
jgi:hypothetical protein